MENTQTGDVKMPITYEDLKQSLVDSGRPYDFDMIDRAYALAEKAHGGQRRRSGEPYICHPLSVASILVELGMDSESIAAALMHDVAEDTPVDGGRNQAEIRPRCGAAGGRRHQADPDQILQCRGPPGREPAQDAAGHEPGRPRDDH